MLESNLVRLI